MVCVSDVEVADTVVVLLDADVDVVDDVVVLEDVAVVVPSAHWELGLGGPFGI